jgi:CO dehydrogenase maturation factor
MEHLSRRTTHKVDLLLIISDPTVRGIHTAKRINVLIDELGLDIGQSALIINRTSGEEFAELKKLAQGLSLEVAGSVPNDEIIFQFDLAGKPILELPPESKALTSVFEILDSLEIP